MPHGGSFHRIAFAACLAAIPARVLERARKFAEAQ